jgi:hypothetical protein
MATRLPSSPRIRALQWLGALAGMALVLGLLRFYPLPRMDLPVLAATVLVLGWLVYQYLEPVRLIRRHAFLAHVTLERSGFRRWFWNGILLRFGLALAALVTAAAAVVLTARLAPYEWWVIAGSVASFALLLVPVSRYCARQFTPQYRFALALRGTYWINLALVAATLAVVQVFWVEVPATHHATLREVTRAAFDAAAGQAAVTQVGWLLGLNAAVTDGIWHLMQVASPAAEGSRWLYVLACGLVLAWSALKLGAVWLVLLGVVSLAARWPAPGERMPGTMAFSRGYGASVLVLLAGLVLVAQLSPGSWPRVLPARDADPCADVLQAEQRAVDEQARQALAERHARFVAGVDARVEARVDEAFALAEAGVERFLDWNFSVAGQYEQLFFMAAAAAGPATFAERVGLKMDEHVTQAMAPALATLGDALEAELGAEIRAAYHGHAAFIDTLLAGTRCLDRAPPALDLEGTMEKSLVGAGAGAGIIAARLGSRVGSKVVGRTAVRRMLAGVATRLGARLATVSQAGSGGALCGPMAPLCVPVIAVTAWLAVDVAINAADEALNRDDMRREMLAVLEAEREAMKAELSGQYTELAARVFNELEDYQAERFRVSGPLPDQKVRPITHFESGPVG